MCSNCILFPTFSLVCLLQLYTLKCCCCHAVRVLFLTQKSPSTSCIATYHVFIAGFAFLDILNDWVLSISLWYEHFSHDTGVTACLHFEAVIESRQQLIPKQAMPQLVTLSCNLVTQKIQTTQKTMHNQTLQKWWLYRTQLRGTLCPRHWCRMRHST